MEGNVYIKDSNNNVLTSCERFQSNCHLQGRNELVNQLWEQFISNKQ